MKHILLITIFSLGLPWSIFAQEISQGEYYFDFDPGYGKGSTLHLSASEQTIEIASLTKGYHELYYRLRCPDNGWGTTFHQSIFISRPSDEITQGEYYFDSDPGLGNGSSMDLVSGEQLNIGQSISLNTLDNGFHLLYYRLKNTHNNWGSTFHQTLFKCEGATEITKGEYFFDEDPGYGNGVHFKLQSGTSLFFLDTLATETLAPGYHRFFYRLQKSDSWGMTQSVPYYQVVTSKLKSLSYSFDDQEQQYVIPLNPQVHFLNRSLDISVSHLFNGDHIMHLWLTNTSDIHGYKWHAPFHISGETNVITQESNTSECIIFPNPSSHTISIKTTSPIEYVKIVSLQGITCKIVYVNFTNITIDELVRGMYLVNIKLKNGLSVLPLSIQTP